MSSMTEERASLAWRITFENVSATEVTPGKSGKVMGQFGSSVRRSAIAR